MVSHAAPFTIRRGVPSGVISHPAQYPIRHGTPCAPFPGRLGSASRQPAQCRPWPRERAGNKKTASEQRNNTLQRNNEQTDREPDTHAHVHVAHARTHARTHVQVRVRARANRSVRVRACICACARGRAGGRGLNLPPREAIAWLEALALLKLDGHHQRILCQLGTDARIGAELGEGHGDVRARYAWMCKSVGMQSLRLRGRVCSLRMRT